MSLVTPNVFLLLQLNSSKDQEGSGCIPNLSYFKRTPVCHLGEEGWGMGGVTEVFFLHGFIDLHALNHWDQMPNSCMKFTVNRYTICYTPFFPSWSQLQQNNIFFFAIKYSRKICEAEKQLCDRSDDCRPHFSTEKSWFKHTSSGLTIDKHPSWLMMPSTVSGHMQTV